MSNPFGAVEEDDAYNPFAANPAQFEFEPEPAYTPKEPKKEPAYSSSSSTYTTPSYVPSEKPSSNQGGVKGAISNTNQKIDNMVSKVPGLTLTEEEIAQREAYLDKREREISAKEQIISDARANGTFDALQFHPKNFPLPFLRIWSFYPEDDIPENGRPLITKVKWVVLVSILVSVINIIGCFGAYSAAAKPFVPTPTSLLITTIIYALILLFLEFELPLSLI